MDLSEIEFYLGWLIDRRRDEAEALRAAHRSAKG